VKSNRPSNPILDATDIIQTTLIMGIGVRGAVAAAQVQYPFLKLPIISQIFSLLVGYIGKEFLGSTKPYVNTKIIAFQNAKQQRAYEESIAKLKAAQQSEDPDAHQKALEQARADIDRLINLNK
jgi:hypothetical protein